MGVGSAVCGRVWVCGGSVGVLVCGGDMSVWGIWMWVCGSVHIVCVCILLCVSVSSASDFMYSSLSLSQL